MGFGRILTPLERRLTTATSPTAKTQLEDDTIKFIQNKRGLIEFGLRPHWMFSLLVFLE
jgi:hypothetical protein